MRPSPRREAILASALELFAKKGYHGTSVPEVAERAGTGAATLYRHFTGKEALVNALYRSWKERLGQALLASLSGQRQPREAFGRFWRALAAFVETHPTAFVFLEVQEHGDYLDRASRQADFELLLPITQILRDWQKRKAIRTTRVDVMMALVFGSFVGLVRASRKFGVPLDAAALEAAETCVWSTLSGR